jgi:glycosyltransferase involved in cell wall biosynthesis
VRMADPEALAAAICALAHDPGRRREMGRAGSSLVRDLFAPERVAADAEKAVEIALA